MHCELPMGSSTTLNVPPSVRVLSQQRIQNFTPYRGIPSGINFRLFDSRLTFDYLPGCKFSPNSLGQISVGRDQVIFLMSLALWREPLPTIPTTKTSSDTQILIEQEAIREFGPIPEVCLIYSDHFRSEYVLSVLLHGDKYNDALMDILLDRELRLMNRFASRPITLQYLPYVPSPSRNGLVRETAKLIFEGFMWPVW